MRRHTGDRPYVCERCGMAFSAKRSLTRHIRVHTGERPYSCNQCVAAFADWTTLHNHKLVHRSPTAEAQGDGSQGQDSTGPHNDRGGSESRPYQCQFCGIRYRQPLSLKRHLLLHSGSSGAEVLKKAAPRKAAKRRAEDGEVVSAEEPGTALHLQYRPYECELCGEKFKHLRGYKTHKNKHENGALSGRKLGFGKRLKQEEEEEDRGAAGGELSHRDIQQAATILASVAVNNGVVESDSAVTVPLEVALGGESVGVGSGAGVPQHISLPHSITFPHSSSSNVVPHTITITHSTGECDTIPLPPPASTAATTITDSTLTHPAPLPLSLLPPVQQPDGGTVTIIDAAAFSTMAGQPPSMHLPVSSAATPMLAEAGEVIQYAPGNVTQVIQYPDGTLSEVTSLVPPHPHPPPPTIIPSSELLDNVVTVVFETRDGSMVLESQ